jgi:hypothetical protein
MRKFREVDDSRLSEVLHSGGQSGNYRSLNSFVYIHYNGYQGWVRFVYLVWSP